MDTFTARITSALKREPVSLEGLDDDQKAAIGRIESLVQALNKVADHMSAPHEPRSDSEYDRVMQQAISWAENAKRHRQTLDDLPIYAVVRRLAERGAIRYAEQMVMHDINYAQRLLDVDRGTNG